MFFQECAPLFDVEGCLRAPLSDSHRIVHIVTGPEVHGWPTARERRLSCGLSLAELVWVGPSQAEIQMHFDSIFRRRCELSGKIFLQSPDQDIRNWVQERMKKRFRFQADVPTVGPEMWRQVLTPMQMQRVHEYRELEPARAGLLDSAYFCDIDHWPGSPGPASGPYLPTLLRHGTILEFSTGRIIMPMERFLSLGFQPFPHLCGCYAWPAGQFAQGLSERQLHSLSGNTQSLPAIMAWYLYCLSHTVKREPFRLIPQVSENVIEPVDEDDELL